MSVISDSVTDDAFNQALEETPDVPEVANEPAPSSETVVVANEADQTEIPQADEAVNADEKPAEEAPKVEASQETSEAKADDNLNWDSAPEQFREKYKALKSQLTQAEANTLKEAYFSDPDKFLDELNGLSTSQFQQTTQQIVRRGIDAAPEDFANYLAEVAPEAVAKTLSQVSPELLAQALGLDMPVDKARKIIAQVKAQQLESYLDENDEGKVAETVQTPKPATAEAKPMTPEDIEKIVTQRIAEAGKPQAIQTLEQDTYTEIMKPVEDLLTEANLKPLPTDSAEDKEFKEWASEQIIRDTFGFLMENEQNAPQAKKMLEMIQNLDKAGAKHLANVAKIRAEDYAGKRIEMLTRNRAQTKTKGTEAKKTPPRVVPSGGVSSFGNPQPIAAGRISEIAESDFEAAGM